MERNRTLDYIGCFIKSINLLMIVAISSIMARTTYLISNSNKAREFLEQIQALPGNPKLIVIISVTTYIILLFVMKIKEKYKNRKLNVMIIFYLLEFLLCYIILISLNMNYNGVILVVIADIIYHIKEKNNKLIFISIMIVIYVFCDYEFVSLIINMVPFNKYLIYYNLKTQSYILGIKGMLTSINIMLFILYVVILMRIQIDENEKILLLNNKLNKANDELKVMNDKLQSYAEKTEKMTETRERNRLAREIHDTIGHALTGIIAGIDACLTIIDYSPEATKKQLNLISKVARQGMNDVRRSVKALRPDALENLPFQEAIEKMVGEIMNASKCSICLENEIGEMKFDSDEEDAIYRVIQEGITNSIRHGKADKIYVTLYKKKNDLILIITDNGTGCSEIKKGFGLQHMRERVELLKGSINFDGENGFTIIAHIPIRWSENDDKSIDCR
ncbi:MAG: sensor histidine kinase [Clostridium sp.]|nr:sensor histidine kinase [Clostridium sp.]